MCRFQKFCSTESMNWIILAGCIQKELYKSWISSDFLDVWCCMMASSEQFDTNCPVTAQEEKNRSEDMRRLTIEEMRDWLEQFYQSAGFHDIRERELKYNSDEEIIQLYHSWH